MELTSRSSNFLPPPVPALGLPQPGLQAVAGGGARSTQFGCWDILHILTQAGCGPPFYRR